MKNKHDIGLVLSGGGHRGVAHIGAIKALEEFGITPNIISGVSAGALVGALYAANYSVEDMLQCFKSVKIFKLSRYARRKPGFVDSEKFSDFLLEYFPKNTFGSLSKSLYVTASDILTGKPRVFSRGNLIQALLASASFPGIFTPVNIGNSLYSDGGILDNFPVDPIKELCKDIIGVYVSPFKKMKVEDFKHSFDVMERVYYLTIYNNSANKFTDCKLLICPEKLGHYSTFNTKDIDAVFEIGYKETMKQLKDHSF